MPNLSLHDALPIYLVGEQTQQHTDDTQREVVDHHLKTTQSHDHTLET